MKNELLEKQAGSRAQVLDAQQVLESELTNMASDQGQLLEAQAAKISLQRKLQQLQKQFVADQAQKLSDAERKLEPLNSAFTKAVDKLERTRLTAPLDGTVQQLAVTTIGQVATTAQPLMVIVPDTGRIQIEALVPNSDVGFVKVGQSAVVKIDAFPFNRFGTIDGKVVRISRDAVYEKDMTSVDATSPVQAQNSSALDSTPKVQNLVFPVTVELDRDSILVDGKQVPLAAGMTASVDIKTGERRVIDYVLAPLRGVISSAAHER